MITRLSQFLVRYSTFSSLALQAILVFFGLTTAWLLRFEFSFPYVSLFVASAPFLIFIRLGLLRVFHLHRGWWRYAGVADAVDVIRAVGLGTALFFVVIRYIVGLSGFPRSIYLLEACITANFLAGARLIVRTLAESVRVDLRSAKRVLLIGAGAAAQAILQEIRQQPDSGYLAIGCVDDDGSKLGIRIHGVPVLGAVDQLPAIVSSFLVDEVLIVAPTASAVQMQRFVEICEKAKVSYKTVPALRDLISREVSIHQLREVRLEDLLGRDPIEIDLDSVRQTIEGQSVLVTGAAGSIGSELCRQILEFTPARLICLDQNETATFYLELELRKLGSTAALHFCVADIADKESMVRIFSEYHPAIVFHAAAYKHVPVMEENIEEAVKNNIFGLQTFLETADDSACKIFVLVSSDKAVNPTSVMGVTKRIAELILCNYPVGPMRCVSVRFGNVLGSNGSVVPILQEQLRNAQQLTITHPRIERFFMTTREAVSLILQAVAIGRHGDILVLDMGRRVRIIDLARTLIQLSGKSEDQVELSFTGLRNGEKLIEELFYANEEVSSTSCPKIKRARGSLHGWPILRRHLSGLRLAIASNKGDIMRAKLREIVPDYSYSSAEERGEVSEISRTDHASLQRAVGLS